MHVKLCDSTTTR